jgi:hypothetical protein
LSLERNCGQKKVEGKFLFFFLPIDFDKPTFLTVFDKKSVIKGKLIFSFARHLVSESTFLVSFFSTFDSIIGNFVW